MIYGSEGLAGARREGKAGSDFVEDTLRPAIHRAMLWSLLATDGRLGGTRPGPEPEVAAGSYQLFAFDFALSESLELFLLEANGRPALCSENDADGPRCRAVPCAGWLVAQTRRMEEEKHQLVRALHEPHRAGGLDLGDLREGERPVLGGGGASGFTLLFSEAQRSCEGTRPPDPCSMLRGG